MTEINLADKKKEGKISWKPVLDFLSGVIIW
jgi:hypothetical protein